MSSPSEYSIEPARRARPRLARGRDLRRLGGDRAPLPPSPGGSQFPNRRAFSRAPPVSTGASADLASTTIPGLAFASGANAEWPTCGHVDAFPGADWRQTDPGRRGWDEAQLDAARQIFSGQPTAAVMVVHRGRQIAAWGDVGMDQLCFGLPIEGLHHEEILATLELFGDKVIPEFDKDRKHSTDYYRELAQPKYPKFAKPLPEGVEWPTVLPESALIQLG